MARNKKESIYKSWDEVNSALKQLAELNIKKQKIEGKTTILVNKIKESMASRAEILASEIKLIEKEIIRFAQQNKAEFIKKRTKKLPFGSISFRITKKICCECVESAIKALKTLNLDSFIRCTESLDKEALADLDKNTLAKAGISVKTEDKVSVEPNYVELASSSILD